MIKLKNTSETYGLIAKAFHWPMAIIMLGLLLLGLYMEGLDPSPDKYELYGLHKSFGLLILWMVGLRLIWRFYTKLPEPHENHQRWERVLAKIAHFLLYVSMIGMPLTGWLMSSAGGHPVGFFGISMPSLMEKNEDFGKLMNETHSILAFTLVGVILLHAAGAMKHHFIDHDNTLKRMMAGPMHKIGPYILIIILGLFVGAVVKLLFIS